MVRRRNASPKPSAPVRSASPSYRAPPPQQRAPVPTAAPMSAPSQGPGLFGQMAATAGGVAIGSAVGHTVGHMLTGGGSSNSAPEQQAQQQYQPAPAQQSYQTPCEIEWKQFLECSQNSSDLSLCQSYNDLFKQCKTRYNM